MDDVHATMAAIKPSGAPIMACVSATKIVPSKPDHAIAPTSILEIVAVSTHHCISDIRSTIVPSSIREDNYPCIDRWFSYPYQITKTTLV